MMTIYKFPINPDFKAITISMPMDAQILHVGVDNKNQICMWALVETAVDYEERKFYCMGTGWNYDDIWYDADLTNYIGTAITEEKEVYHIFEDLEDMF